MLFTQLSPVRSQYIVLSLYLLAITLCALVPKKDKRSIRTKSWTAWAIAFVVCLCLTILGVYPLTPYPLTHLSVALMFYFGALLLQKLNANIDAVSFAGLLGGTGFYLGREFCQAETLHYVDWAGILVPLAGCVTVFITLDQVAKRQPVQT